MLPRQQQVLGFYTNAYSQQFVALLIILNFMTNIIEKEIDPPMGEKYRDTWQALEDAFNVIFLIELIINFYGSFFVPFWKSGWNIFDFLVVTVGVCSLLRVDLGPLSLLRMLRAFRVFRLFKRIKSLKKIIDSLGKAVPGVVNAFVIMFIFMCIYAILGVEFFANFGGDGIYNAHQLGNEEGHPVDAITARGYTYGEEYYGTFSRSLYTLWQVLTGESWSEAIARPLLFGWSGAGAGFYYVSFLVITQIVLVNVVVAVLLEKMVDEDPTEPEEATSTGTPRSRSVSQEAHKPKLPAEPEGRPHALPRPQALPPLSEAALSAASADGLRLGCTTPYKAREAADTVTRSDSGFTSSSAGTYQQAAEIAELRGDVRRVEARLSEVHEMLKLLTAGKGHAKAVRDDAGGGADPALLSCNPVPETHKDKEPGSLFV